jgi:endonuclease YncB( thermonuclease family)
LISFLFGGFSMAYFGKFIRCFDGDTLDIQNEQGVVFRCRLWGMDAPEKGQLCFRRSALFLQRLLDGQILLVQERGVDLHGRHIVRVSLLDGRDVSLVMIEAGMAWWYRPFAKKEWHLARAERDARIDKRGLWRENTPIPPWAWRHGGRRGFPHRRIRITVARTRKG